jgi:transposase-like protein
MNEQTKNEVKTYVVNCPQCSASLQVEGGNFAHVCPVCSNMFRVRVGTRMVRDLTKDKTVEAYVSVNRDNNGGETVKLEGLPSEK